MCLTVGPELSTPNPCVCEHVDKHVLYVSVEVYLHLLDDVNGISYEHLTICRKVGRHAMQITQVFKQRLLHCAMGYRSLLEWYLQLWIIGLRTAPKDACAFMQHASALSSHHF